MGLDALMGLRVMSGSLRWELSGFYRRIDASRLGGIVLASPTRRRDHLGLKRGTHGVPDCFDSVSRQMRGIFTWLVICIYVQNYLQHDRIPAACPIWA